MKFLTLLNALLSPRQKRHYLLLQGVFFLTALVQIAGVASVAPFIALVSNPALIHTNRFAIMFGNLVGATSDKQFLVMFAVSLMAMIALSNAVQAYALWLTVGFGKRLGIELQRDIFHGYIHRDYVSFSRVNSSTLIATVTYSIGRLVYMVVTPLLNLISSAFVVILIVSGLLVYRPMVGLVGGAIVGAGYYAVFVLVKKRLEKHGKAVGDGAHKKHRLLTESLGGIKEIKLAGSESEYESRLDVVARASLTSETLIAMYGDLPRFFLEALALCALLGLGIVLLLNTDTPSSIVGVLSLYAMAGYRLLPAAQTVFKSASQLRANADVIDELKPHVEIGRATKHREQNAAPVGAFAMGPIECRNLSYVYPGTESPVLRDVSFAIPERSIAVLVGASGAGKSTMADLLLGLLTPSSGEIRVGGRPIADEIKGWQRNVGYVAQSIFILDDTIAANICFGTSQAPDMDRVRRAAQLAQLDDFIQTLPEQFDFRVGERGALLSGGQRQRLGIARALYRDCDLIVMDEATSALDSLTERDVIGTLEHLKETKTVVMIAHRISTIRCADQVILFADGRLVADGTFDELVRTNPMFREMVAVDEEQDEDATATASVM